MTWLNVFVTALQTFKVLLVSCFRHSSSRIPIPSPEHTRPSSPCNVPDPSGRPTPQLSEQGQSPSPSSRLKALSTKITSKLSPRRPRAASLPQPPPPRPGTIPPPSASLGKGNPSVRISAATPTSGWNQRLLGPQSPPESPRITDPTATAATSTQLLRPPPPSHHPGSQPIPIPGAKPSKPPKFRLSLLSRRSSATSDQSEDRSIGMFPSPPPDFGREGGNSGASGGMNVGGPPGRQRSETWGQRRDEIRGLEPVLRRSQGRVPDLRREAQSQARSRSRDYLQPTTTSVPYHHQRRNSTPSPSISVSQSSHPSVPSVNAIHSDPQLWDGTSNSHSLSNGNSNSSFSASSNGDSSIERLPRSEYYDRERSRGRARGTSAGSLGRILRAEGPPVQEQSGRVESSRYDNNDDEGVGDGDRDSNSSSPSDPSPALMFENPRGVGRPQTQRQEDNPAPDPSQLPLSVSLTAVGGSEDRENIRSITFSQRSLPPSEQSQPRVLHYLANDPPSRQLELERASGTRRGVQPQQSRPIVRTRDLDFEERGGRIVREPSVPLVAPQPVQVARPFQFSGSDLEGGLGSGSRNENDGGGSESSGSDIPVEIVSRRYSDDEEQARGEGNRGDGQYRRQNRHGNGSIREAGTEQHHRAAQPSSA